MASAGSDDRDATGAKAAGLMAQQKLPKAKVDYRLPGRYRPNGERCGLCTMFRPPSDCTAVVGPVDRDGWCKIFHRKKTQ